MKLIITDKEEFKIPIAGEHKVIKPAGDIHQCVGCFGCWVKTPGKCVIHDGYESTGVDMSKCEELILVSQCCYGSVSPFVKAVQDRAISYVHPDFTIRGGEMHHKRRYQNQILFSAHFYGENITELEKEVACALINANADNYEGVVKGVYFHKEKELEGISL